MTVSALFIDPKGIYPKLLGPENCWDEARDARTYAGPHPVVCHSPCTRWVNMAAVNYTRSQALCTNCDGRATLWFNAKREWRPCYSCDGTGRREPNRKIILPAWYPGGTDDGCFESALKNVRQYGGVLEHPAFTHAWEHHGLGIPKRGLGYWILRTFNDGRDYWTAEVWQSAYGHKARKRTWLLYCSFRPPFELNWSREPGTCQIGWFDRKRPTLSKREANGTPVAFAEELVRLAEWSRT